MAAWRDRFRTLVSEIENHPMLVVTTWEIREPASSERIERATRHAGGKLPEGMAEIYREMDGMTLEWRLRDGVAFEAEQAPFGTVNLLPILLDRGESIFGSWKNVAWFDDQDRYRHVVPFDFFTPEEAAAFHPIDGDMTVYYHYFGETLHSTGRSFREYIELLFQSRGLYSWLPSLCAEE